MTSIKVTSDCRVGLQMLGVHSGGGKVVAMVKKYIYCPEMMAQ